MKSIQKQYTKEIHQQFGYWGIWLPSTQHELGTIGIIRNHVFHPISSLKNEGIPFSITRDKEEVNHEYASKGAVNIQQKLEGETVLPGSSLSINEAGIRFDFNRDCAIYFKLMGAKTSLINDTLNLEHEIIKRYEKDEWKKDWVVITQLITSTKSTVFISNGTKAEIEFKVGISRENHLPIDFNSKHQLVYEKNMAYKMLTENKTTPLFKIWGISGNWFSKKTMQPKQVSFKKAIAEKKKPKLIDIHPNHFE